MEGDGKPDIEPERDWEMASREWFAISLIQEPIAVSWWGHGLTCGTAPVSGEPLECDCGTRPVAWCRGSTRLVMVDYEFQPTAFWLH